MRYFYQENGDDVEIILETKEGFEWVCDCGDKSKQDSWYKAIIICNALNDVFKNQMK